MATLVNHKISCISYSLVNHTKVEICSIVAFINSSMIVYLQYYERKHGWSSTAEISDHGLQMP